jgi:hypothetical protein
MLQLTEAQHRARIKKLRAQGYRIKIVSLPNGTKVVLKSKKAFVCRGAHCVSRSRIG